MLFYSTEPNLVVISRKTKQPIARFNKDKKLNTYDPILIEKLKRHFKYRKNVMADICKIRKEVKEKGMILHRNTTEAEMLKFLKESEENGESNSSN